MSQASQKEQQKRAKDFLLTKLQNMDEGLAGQMRDAYVEIIEEFNENLKVILRNGFGMDRDDIYDFLNEAEKDTFDFTVTELKSIFNNSPVNVRFLRKFNAGFKRDEEGNPRDWRKVEENKIKELYDKCKV